MSFSKKDAELKPQVVNFSTVLAASPAVYQQTSTTATAVTAAVNSYVDSYDALTEARANGVRSEQMTTTKDDNRATMLDVLRPIYAYIQDSSVISDTAKVAIGVHVKSTTNTPQPVPQFAPLASIVKVDGSNVTLRMADPNEPDSRARPIYTAGIAVFSHIGEEPPVLASDFKFEGNTGRTTVTVPVPPSVASGAKVWFTCFYFNNRKDSGPACSPISATIGAGATMPMTMKIAA
jgi:hypothetical protein